MTYINIEGPPQQYESGWAKDPVGTGLLSAVGGQATSWLLKIIPLPKAISMYKDSIDKGGGAASAFARSYMGYQIQCRITAQIVPYHHWYGRYKMNLWTKEILAVDFQGRGPSMYGLVNGKLEERLADGEGNVIFDAYPPQQLDVSNAALGEAHSLPETSYGY